MTLDASPEILSLDWAKDRQTLIFIFTRWEGVIINSPRSWGNSKTFKLDGCEMRSNGDICILAPQLYSIKSDFINESFKENSSFSSLEISFVKQISSQNKTISSRYITFWTLVSRLTSFRPVSRVTTASHRDPTSSRGTRSVLCLPTYFINKLIQNNKPLRSCCFLLILTPQNRRCENEILF